MTATPETIRVTDLTPALVNELVRLYGEVEFAERACREERVDPARSKRVALAIAALNGAADVLCAAWRVCGADLGRSVALQVARAQWELQQAAR